MNEWKAILKQASEITSRTASDRYKSFTLANLCTRPRQGYYIPIIIIALLAGVFLAYKFFGTTENIINIIQENNKVKSSLANLADEEVIGYIKLIEDNGISKKIWFGECTLEDRLKIIAEKVIEIEGDIVYFDLMAVTFENKLIMSDKHKTLYFWQRIYRDRDAPEEGIDMNAYGVEPERYSALFKNTGLPKASRKNFWKDLCSLSRDTNRLLENGIQALHLGLFTSLEGFKEGDVFKIVLSEKEFAAIQVDSSLNNIFSD